jgi:hypothetical protein
VRALELQCGFSVSRACPDRSVVAHRGQGTTLVVRTELSVELIHFVCAQRSDVGALD